MIKRTLGTALLTLMLVPLVGTVSAQQIGFTNQEAILANMPEMDSVRAQIQQEAQAQQQEFQQEQQEFQQQLEKYQQQQALLSDERKAQREQELRQQRQELQQSAQERDQYLAQREAELMQPLLDELQGAIDAVAQQQNLDVVLRTQALLYVNDESVVDITPAVADRLGIQLDQQAQPGPSVDNVETPASGTGSGGN